MNYYSNVAVSEGTNTNFLLPVLSAKPVLCRVTVDRDRAKSVRDYIASDCRPSWHCFRLLRSTATDGWDIRLHSWVNWLYIWAIYFLENCYLTVRGNRYTILNGRIYDFNHFYLRAITPRPAYTFTQSRRLCNDRHLAKSGSMVTCQPIQYKLSKWRYSHTDKMGIWIQVPSYFSMTTYVATHY